MSETLEVGDVFTMRGTGVPKELEPMYWRVKAIDANGEKQLDGPYLDAECQRRYHPAYPRRPAGW